MSVNDDIREAHAGRPRDDLREQAILDAACELLVEVGYDQLSMEAVAARAHASKATIYRRWSNKSEMVAEALRRRALEKIDPPDCGSLRADLFEMLSHICEECSSSDGALVAGVMREMRNSPDLAELVRTNVIEQKEGIPPIVIERAIARGELSPQTDASVVNEVLPSMVFMRLLLTGDALDEGFVRHLIDDVAIPLLRPVTGDTSHQ